MNTRAVLIFVVSLAAASGVSADVSRTPRVVSLTGGATAISGNGERLAIGGNLWTEAGGFMFTPGLPGTTSRSVRALNYDGTVGAVTGTTSNGQLRAGRLQGTTMIPLQTIGGSFPDAEAEGVTSDGAVIVGSAVGNTGVAVRWESPSAQPIPLQSVPGSRSRFASGISGNGQVIVGTVIPLAANQYACQWTASGVQALTAIPGQRSAGAIDASMDGSVIVGWAKGVEDRYRAVRWDGFGVTDMGRLPGYTEAFPQAVSADGSTAVGYSRGGINVRAVVWYGGSVRSIADVLTNLGVSTTGWEFLSAEGISDDGLIVVGSARVNGQPRGYMAVIPSPGSAAWVLGVVCAVGGWGRQRRRW